ncbi:MAG: hypothetical protein ACLPX1_18130 [Steroidobacteraceae bacterium]
MNSKISTKLAALGMALMMNAFILGGITYLFNSQPAGNMPVPVLAAA